MLDRQRSFIIMLCLLNAADARWSAAFVPSHHGGSASRMQMTTANGAAANGFSKKNGFSAGSNDATGVSTKNVSTKNGVSKNGFSTKNGASIQKQEFDIPDSNSLPLLSNEVLRVLPNGGCITLVGSGPGDPDLLTVAAHRILSDPSILVICDRLVSPEIRSIIKGEVKVARKLPGCAELAQEEIYAWAHHGLQEGKHVVRLKIGDPFVFGRGGEEVLKFRQYGVEPKVIPGVSAAFSAPLLGSIPVTHRGVSNQVVMCTGYGRDGTSPDLIRYHKEQTIVFLMAVGRLRELCHRLVTMAGYPSKTPVAIVEKAGCPTQRTVVGTMETIADLAERHQIKPPSTIVVGDVVNVLLEKEQGEQISGLIQNCTASMELV